MARNRSRKTLLVDTFVQGGLVLRYLSYWLVSLLAVFVMLFFWNLLTGPARLSWMTVEDVWFKYGPAFVASVLLLPFIIYDSLKTSHRFAGPILRIRRELKKLANGEEVTPVVFRKGDYWRDMADDFNRVVARLREAENERTAPTMLELAEQNELATLGR